MTTIEHLNSFLNNVATANETHGIQCGSISYEMTVVADESGYRVSFTRNGKRVPGTLLVGADEVQVIGIRGRSSRDLMWRLSDVVSARAGAWARAYCK